MRDPSPIKTVRDEIRALTLVDLRETRFFGPHDGALCQWIILTIKNTGLLDHFTVEVHSGKQSATTRLFLGPVWKEQPCRVHAPLRWPADKDENARLIIRYGGRVTEAVITIGSYRPWTLYLLSDACVDDTWSYDDVKSFDRDDYLTTAAELAADTGGRESFSDGQPNRYNLPTNYQLDRFYRQATPPQRRAAGAAVRDGRLYISPVPNQLNCAAYNLASYPLLLEPYRRLCARAGLDSHALQRDAYHMEAPTWSNGLANLLNCAGFDGLSKSILNFRSPWTQVLRDLPRVSRLEVGPGRFMHFALTCDAYSDGLEILAGVESANAFLHDRWLPQLEQSGRLEGTAALPLFGMYCDLMRRTHKLVADKQAVIAAYNSQGWTYPRLVNATWPQFFDHIRKDYGPADKPIRGRAVRTLRGDSGASWELWMSAIQTQHARFRRAQRDVTSLHSLDAMLCRPTRSARRELDAAVADLVQLGDHAWNGSHDKGRALNLSIRRGRLDRIEKRVQSMRDAAAPLRPSSGNDAFAVVNTLGWPRTCRVSLDAKAWGLATSDTQRGRPCLRDADTHASFALHADPIDDARKQQWTAYIPDVPAFGARRLELAAADERDPIFLQSENQTAPISPSDMRPICTVDGKPIKMTGRWHTLGDRGEWHGAGPDGGFHVNALWRPSPIAPGAWALSLLVKGQPPTGTYELAWHMAMPWKRVRWRGESGGGFVTPGAPAHGGDWLGGVGGSIFAAGDGLAALGGRGHLAMAFDQTGMCRLADLTGTQPLRGITTDGRLTWVLLGTGVNPVEAMRDQGGDRSWRFDCTLRRGVGPITDAGLYRFTAGCYRPAEVVNLARLGGVKALDKPWLQLDTDQIICLGVRRRGGHTEVDLYNPTDQRLRVALNGTAVARRPLVQTDMLGRPLKKLSAKKLTLDGRAFSRVAITPR